MEDGFFRESSDYCPNCKKHTLLAHSISGKPIYYVTKIKNVTTANIMEKVNNDTISELVCGNCGKHFKCDYSLGFPRAITSEAMKDLFFTGYYNHNK